jgi:hypothetical protein
MRPTLSLAAVTAACAAYAAAQVATSGPATSNAPPPSLSQVGMIIYPAKGQPKEQQKADEQACVEWAESQTGLRLQSGTVNVDSAAAVAEGQMAEATTGAAVAGAARGAAGGAIVGAIAGDAGEGAAIGAVAGAIGGRRAKRQAEAAAAQAGAQHAQAKNQQAIDTFKRAAGVCLQGRGYTIS